MACRLFGAKPLSEPIMIYFQSLYRSILMKIIWNSKVFIKETAFENIVCEMAAILSPPLCVNRQYIFRYLEIEKLSTYRVKQCGS